jgi:hypothetical protein
LALQNLVDELFKGEIGLHSYFLAEAMPEHQYAAWCYG